MLKQDERFKKLIKRIPVDWAKVLKMEAVEGNIYKQTDNRILNYLQSIKRGFGLVI